MNKTAFYINTAVLVIIMSLGSTFLNVPEQIYFLAGGFYAIYATEVFK